MSRSRLVRDARILSEATQFSHAAMPLSDILAGELNQGCARTGFVDRSTSVDTSFVNCLQGCLDRRRCAQRCVSPPVDSQISSRPRMHQPVQPRTSLNCGRCVPGRQTSEDSPNLKLASSCPTCCSYELYELRADRFDADMTDGSWQLDELPIATSPQPEDRRTTHQHSHDR